MAVKKKVKAKTSSKTKKSSKVRPIRKTVKAKAKKINKPAVKSKKTPKPAVKKAASKPIAKSPKKPFEKPSSTGMPKLVFKPLPKFVNPQPVTMAERFATKPKANGKSRQIISPVVISERRAVRTVRSNQTFAYMKAPGLEHAFDVGDTVEVFCDHEKNRERIRGWVRGIVVQVDHKMVAVQFRSNVFLTDGWMVPDRILWYPLASDQIRSTDTKKAIKKENIPDY